MHKKYSMAVSVFTSGFMKSGESIVIGIQGNKTFYEQSAQENRMQANNQIAINLNISS